MAIVEYTWNSITDNVIEETDGAGNASAVFTSTPEFYGSLLSCIRTGSTSFFHFDALGSTRIVTDATQAEVGGFDYDAWGNITQIAEPGTASQRWCAEHGYECDNTTTSYYVRSRRYSSRLARWMSTDPLRFVDGTNLYSYVGNHPVSASDPSGTSLRISRTAPTPMIFDFNATGRTTYEWKEIGAPQVSCLALPTVPPCCVWYRCWVSTPRMWEANIGALYLPVGEELRVRLSKGIALMSQAELDVTLLHEKIHGDLYQYVSELYEKEYYAAYVANLSVVACDEVVGKERVSQLEQDRARTLNRLLMSRENPQENNLPEITRNHPAFNADAYYHDDVLAKINKGVKSTYNMNADCTGEWAPEYNYPFIYYFSGSRENDITQHHMEDIYKRIPKPNVRPRPPEEWLDPCCQP